MNRNISKKLLTVRFVAFSGTRHVVRNVFAIVWWQWLDSHPTETCLGLLGLRLRLLPLELELCGQFARRLRGGLGTQLRLASLLDVVHDREAAHEVVDLDLQLLDRPAEELCGRRFEEGKEKEGDAMKKM